MDLPDPFAPPPPQKSSSNPFESKTPNPFSHHGGSSSSHQPAPPASESISKPETSSKPSISVTESGHPSNFLPNHLNPHQLPNRPLLSRRSAARGCRRRRVAWQAIAWGQRAAADERRGRTHGRAPSILCVCHSGTAQGPVSTSRDFSRRFCFMLRGVGSTGLFDGSSSSGFN